jgi:glutamate/tyrosine decarboxylase-like PLP-dependent enzyme
MRMRTGIKTLARKLYAGVDPDRKRRYGVDRRSFPSKPLASTVYRHRLNEVVADLQRRDLTRVFGSLYTVPHPAAVRVVNELTGFNAGNLGDWSDDRSFKLEGTAELEYEVIQKLAGLYRMDRSETSGYVTTGGTEGNLFSVWLGRTELSNYCLPEEICLVKTDLTHYSVDKAARVCAVSQYSSPLHVDDWHMDPAGFASTVERLYRRGYRGFIVACTLGYTTTGTFDDSSALAAVAADLSRRYEGIRFFFWTDAASMGIVLPFRISGFRPFASPLMQTFVVDFHKYGLAPYPAGVVLYRRHLRQGIVKPVPYLSETDATLLGSRPGTPAAAIWALIHTFGASGYKQLFDDQMENKIFFLDAVRDILPQVKIVTDSRSLSAGIIFRGFGDMRLPRSLEDKYSLHPAVMDLTFMPNTVRKETVYKVFFLPHIRRRMLVELIGELKRIR